jgi:uncharacterized protein DUF2442/uncharacterized protein DUF4160
MPIISTFFGVVVRMFYEEHEPAHFHAEHQGEQGKFDLRGRMTVGNIRSRTALRLIEEWARRTGQNSRRTGAPSRRGGRWNGSNPLTEVDAMFLPSVVEAQHRGDFRIHLIFNDGSSKTVDFRSWLKGPIFAPLKQTSYFRRFFLDGGTVVWPNGADIAPETLYEAPGVLERPKKRRQRTRSAI